jgi:hypothetical protein
LKRRLFRFLSTAGSVPKKKNDQALLIARSVEDPQKSEQKTGAFIGEHDDHLAHQLIGIQILP